MHRLEEKLRKRLTGERYGSFETLFKGGGVSVSDTRRYQAGDQKSTINRKQTAKHDQLYVNEYDAERSLHVKLFLDINANRATGITIQNRSLVQEFLADYMVFALSNSVITEGYLPTKAGFVKGMLSKEEDWLRRYNEAELLVKNRENNSFESSLSNFVDHAKTSTKRCIYIIVSDFWEMNEELHATIIWLNKKSIVVGVRIPSTGVVGKKFSFLNSQIATNTLPVIEL